MLLIKNGRVLDPASRTDAALDVLLNGEKIEEVAPSGKGSVPQGAEVFDATGLIVAPGFIDLHAHLREPGQESSETIESGTRAAARGGFTAVCCMPNTKPGRGLCGQQGRSDCRNRGHEGSGDRSNIRRWKTDRNREAGAPGNGLLRLARASGD